MVRKTAKGARRMKDTAAQKRKKKRLQHFGGKSQPMEFCHDAINQGWDRQKTLQQNYAAMGLSTDPNRCLPIKRGDQQRALEMKERGTKTVKISNVLEELNEVQNMPKPAPYQVRSMSVAEQKRLQLLIQKHGSDNYAAMARDIKINVMQLTEAQIKKRVELYNRLQNL